MRNVNGVNIQEDSDRDCPEIIINSLPRGKKREDARRKHKEQSWFELTGNKMTCPNARSEGQKRRWAKVREEARQQSVHQDQAKRLAKAWGGTYNLNREGK